MESYSLIRRLTLPTNVADPADLIRWGGNGLAFRTAGKVHLIGSSRLVPTDPATDLVTTVQAAPSSAFVGAPFIYTIQVSNQGLNPARNAIISAAFSDYQSISSAVPTMGTPVITELKIALPIAEIAPCNSVTLSVTATPLEAGSLTCNAGVNSDAIDSVFSNNTAFKLVAVGFQTTTDSSNLLRVSANNLVHDPTRGLLWISLPATVEAPLGKSVVSINPLTGFVSDPIPLNANPYSNSMAISANGRYLYLGLTDVSEVHRIDLSLPVYPSLRIPLGPSQWGGSNFAQDLEVLTGDGTSFLMAGSGDHAAAVYDSLTMRPDRTGIYTVDRIERTGTQGAFIGYNNYTSGFDLTRLSITPTGITVVATNSGVIGGYYQDMRGEGNRILSGSGLLVDSSTLTLSANLGLQGTPCLDTTNGRAYMVAGGQLHAFDVGTGNTTGIFPLPGTTVEGSIHPIQQVQKCIRWGLDGFAILNNKNLVIARWSLAVPALMDADSDGIADRWEATHFTSLIGDNLADGDNAQMPVSFEYFFGTSPKQPDGNMVSSLLVTRASLKFIRLVFPRRAGLIGSHHGYEISSDLKAWSSVNNATETILSAQTIDGINVENVEVLVPRPADGSTFVRMSWK